MKQKIKEITSLTQELNKLKTLQQETLKENTELSGVKVNQFGCRKYLFIQHLEVQCFGELDHYLNHMWQGSWLLQDHQQSKISKVMIFFITHWLLIVNWIYRNNTISFRLITRHHKINLQHYSCSWNLWTLRRVLSWVLKKMHRKSNKS